MAQLRIDWPEVECVRCDASAPAESCYLKSHSVVGASSVTVHGIQAPDTWERCHVGHQGAAIYLCPTCREEVLRRGK